jgi:hypothetical protein
MGILKNIKQKIQENSDSYPRQLYYSLDSKKLFTFCFYNILILCHLLESRQIFLGRLLEISCRNYLGRIEKQNSILLFFI